MSRKKKSRFKPCLSLLLDFCNIKEWKLETLLKLSRDHNIGYFSGDFSLSLETILCETRADEKCYCLIQDVTSKKLQKKFPLRYILPTQDQFNDLWPMLQMSQARYKIALNECIHKGAFEISFLMRVVAVLESAKWTVIEGNNENWMPYIYPDIQPCSAIETHIDFEIANILVKEQGEEIFPFLYRCPICGKFGLGRVNQRYCGRKCKNKANRYSTEKMRLYKREYRSEGSQDIEQKIDKSEIQRYMKVCKINEEEAIEMIKEEM